MELSFECEECAREGVHRRFKTRQALGSHLRYTHGSAAKEKQQTSVKEKDTNDMLDFFELVEKGRSPIEACLELQINPQSAERWSRIYKRLAMRGSSETKQVLDTLKTLSEKVEEMEKFVVQQYRSRKATEEIFCKIIAEQTWKAIQEHEKKFHRPFFA